MSALRFDQVRLRVGSGRHAFTVVDGVDLTIPSGAVVGLVGESGSGKSTLARAAAGLSPLSSGQILLDNQPLRKALRKRGVVQMMFQNPASSLDPRMTIGASIAEAIPRSRIRSAADRRAEVARLLKLLDLEPSCSDAYPAQLSGGQRQRVAIARALAAEPEVIIADEITSALDVSIQGAVLNLVGDLQRQLGFSMLFISHNISVIRYVSDFVAVIYLGQIVEHGPTRQVLDNPQHPYTRDLLAAAPVAGERFPDITDSTFKDIADAEPPDPHHPPAGCHYHPRCPIGPFIHPDRTDCENIRPSPAGHLNDTACHYAPVVDIDHGPPDDGARHICVENSGTSS